MSACFRYLLGPISGTKVHLPAEKNVLLVQDTLALKEKEEEEEEEEEEGEEEEVEERGECIEQRQATCCLTSIDHR